MSQNIITGGIIAPTVHLNGTSREQLLEPLLEAAASLHGTITAIAKCAPNGRDYYPQTSDAINRAIHEHRQRLARVQAVLDELCAMAEAIG